MNEIDAFPRQIETKANREISAFFSHDSVEALKCQEREKWPIG